MPNSGLLFRLLSFIRDCAKMLADSVGRTHPDPEAHLFASLLTATFSTAYIEALGQQRKERTSGEVQVTFINLIDRGFEGIAAAMKATPYCIAADFVSPGGVPNYVTNRNQAHRK